MSSTRITLLELERYLAGELPAEEARRAEQWIHGDPARTALVEMLRTRAFGASGRTVDVDVEWRRLSESLEEGAGRARRSGLKSWGGRPGLYQRSGRRALGTQPLRAGLWIGTLATAIGAAVILMMGRVGRTPRDVVHVYTTGPYQQGIINLDDGTRVTLVPKTTLRVLRVGTQGRTVALENGEAYFEVARASGAPFIVQSGAVTAQVLGTAFLVQHRENDRHVRVAVSDGKVRVTTPTRADHGVTLTGGQIGDVTDSVTRVSTVDEYTPGTEWAPGRVIFRYTPLTAVLQTVSQWYGFHFRYADQTLGTRAVTIMISTRSSAEALAAIEQVLAVNLTVVGDTVTLVPQPLRSSHTAPRIRTYDVWTPIREVGR